MIHVSCNPGRGANHATQVVGGSHASMAAPRLRFSAGTHTTPPFLYVLSLAGGVTQGLAMCVCFVFLAILLIWVPTNKQNKPLKHNNKTKH